MNPGASLAWKALKSYRCPKCGDPLGRASGGHECSGSHCDFYITQKRFDDLVTKLTGKAAPRRYPSHGEQENQRYLNSL